MSAQKEHLRYNLRLLDPCVTAQLCHTHTGRASNSNDLFCDSLKRKETETD